MEIQGIYLIMDPTLTNNRSIFDIASWALSGGVSVIQYRDKISDRSEFLENSFQLKEICDSAEIPFIVNDAVDVALLTNSYGVHLGQSDLPIDYARQILSSDQIVGLSNDGMEQAKESEHKGSDYVAVGAVFPTRSLGKSSRIPVGLKKLEQIVNRMLIPVVAIGGISEDNLYDVRKTGVASACIVSDITLSESPENKVKNLRKIWFDY